MSWNCWFEYRITVNISPGYVFSVLLMVQYADSSTAATRSLMAFSAGPSKSTRKRTPGRSVKLEWTADSLRHCSSWRRMRGGKAEEGWGSRHQAGER